MNKFLVLLVLAYARADKLDLTYLPPPGAQYAGGRPGDIQVPLEFPKETYTTTLRPEDIDSEVTNPEDYQATIGINRGQPIEITDSDVTTVTKAPFSYFQNTNRVPTTTVSYAFTQTTTHPPPEGFETTIVPQLAGADYRGQDGFHNFQSQEPGFTYQGDDQQQTQLAGQQPVQGLLNQYPSFGNQEGSIVTNENQQAQNPGLQQNGNGFRGQRPTSPSSGSVTLLPETAPQSQGNRVTYQQDLQGQNRPGINLTGNQYGEQNPTSAPVNQYFNSPLQNQGIIKQDIGDQRQNNFNQQQQGYRQPISGVRPGLQFGQTQLQNQTNDANRLVNQPGFISSTTTAPGFPSTTEPGLANGNRVDIVPGSVAGRPRAPQANFPAEIGTDRDVNEEDIYQQQFPQSQMNGEQVFNGNRQNIIRPSSTGAAPTLLPGSQKVPFPTGTSVALGSYPTPGYPDTVYTNLNGGEPDIYRQKPERPQTNDDRNAVILNYENVITPDGFAYTFDTSNGIHADESGTTTDGVKAKGSYSYIGDDGKLYSIVYTADENGYQPQGDHLPTPPPIPEAIQEVIEKVMKEKEAGIYHDGSYDDDKYGYKNYEGALRYRPQGPKKQIMNAAVIPEEYATVPSDKQRRPQTAAKKPIVSSAGELSDIDISNQEPSQYENEGNKGYAQTPGLISTQRPVDKVTVSDGRNEEGIQDNEAQNKYIEVSSKRPFKQPMRKPLNKIQDISSNVNKGLSSNRKNRPGNEIVSEEIEDQSFSDYGLEEPSVTRISNKGLTRRPQYNQQDDTSLEYDTSSKHPLRPGSHKRPVLIKPGYTKEQVHDEYETPEPTSKLPSRRPSNKSVTENIRDQYITENRYIENSDNDKPLKYDNSNEEDSSRVTNDYGDSELVTKQPSRLRPGSRKPSSSRDQSTRRRPAYISTTPSTQNEGIDNQYPETYDEYVDSQVSDYTPSQKYGIRRPVTGKPTKADDQDVESEQDYSENAEEGYYNPATTTVNYDKTRTRPQGSTIRGQHKIQNIRGQLQIGDKQILNTSNSKFGQKLVRPSVNQQNIRIEYEDNLRPSNEAGYQYIPPQIKFKQEKTQRFPVQNTGSAQITSSRRPANIFSDKSKLKSKPFMTPNVSRDQTTLVSEDEYDQEEENPHTIPSTGQKQQINYDGEYPQYPDSETTPDQLIDDGMISSTKSPNNIRYGSTYGPSTTTGRPSTPQNNRNEPSYVTSVTTGNRRPIQGIDRNNGTKYQVPYNGVTSTTTLPSTRPYYGSTYRPSSVEDQTNYITGSSQIPGQDIVSSTTPFPSRKPVIVGGYRQNTNAPQYETTFGPVTRRPGTARPTTEYVEGTTAQGLPDVTSTYSPSNVGQNQNVQYGSNLPSTTYRPNYTITGPKGPSFTTAPELVDGFGRPITPGYSSTVQDNTPGSMTRQPIRDQTDVQYQPDVRPNQQFIGQRYRPGTKLVQQNGTPAPTFQSSTQKIIGEDFSGPKQQQKFDPETGYYY